MNDSTRKRIRKQGARISAHIAKRGDGVLVSAGGTSAGYVMYDGGGGGLGGDAIFCVNGVEVDRKRVDKTVAGRFGIDTFGVGLDTGAPVSEDY